jgi:phospholipid/cholesterol/gamma-HCH transport system substrate-binding protein
LAELAIKPTTGQRLRSLVVIAAAIALTATLALLLIGGGGDLLARRTTITTYMPDGTGLAGYSVVRVNGIPIGKVTSFEISGLLDPQRAVKVEMRVVTRFLKNIPIDSQTNLGKDTLVGYPFIDIDLGKSRITLPENGVLQSESVQAAYIRADQMRAMESTFQQVIDLLTSLASPDTELGSFITRSSEYDDLIQKVADFDRGMNTLLTPRSSLGQAFYTAEVYDSIHGRVLDVDQALQSIQSGNGQLGRLFVDSNQYANAVQKLVELRQTLADINSGKGKFGQLVADDQTWRSITKMLASTDAMLASLNAGQGRAGELLLSPQLYESLSGALRELQNTLKDVHGDPKKYLRYKVF